MTDKNNSNENVVSLAARREEKASSKPAEVPSAPPPPSADFSFEEIMRANKEKEDKLKIEREKANKAVKRSYRLTPKTPNK